MRSSAALLLAASTLALSACGADDPTTGAADPQLTAAAARLENQAPAPVAAGALAQIADVAETRRRVGYVNPEALAALLPGRESHEVTERILGRGARFAVTGRTPPGTVVQVGSVTVVNGKDGKRDVEGDGPVARSLAGPTPERSVIQPVSPGAVQACLGDAAAQTIVGSALLGSGTTIGVGLRSGADAPAGLKLVICMSPHYRKQLYGSIRAMERRFGRPDENDPRAPVIGEDEIGEQQISVGVIPAGLVDRKDLLDLLEGGAALRSLLPAPPR